MIKKTFRTAPPQAITLALCALLLLAVPATVLTEAQTTNTQATVTFTDGSLEIGEDMQGSGLAFQFGSHEIPAVAVSYPAINEADGSAVDHVLPVVDSRYTSGEWQVTVELTAFADSPIAPTSSFAGVIRLQSPAVANANSSASTTGLTVESDISIISGEDAVPVMTADDTLARGIYTATWTNANVTLSLSDEAVLDIQPSAYEATLRWTLNQGPM